MLLSKLLSVCALTTAAGAATSWIVPGAVWLDTNGQKIDAHGGMVLKEGSLFYWIGYSISNNITPFLYTSPNLVDWTPARNPISTTPQIWRPKLARPNPSSSWYIYGQIDRNVQALRSSSLNSTFTPSGPKTTLPPSGYTYSDTGIFLDDDGTWYLLTSADHNNVQINTINPDGSVGARVNVLAKGAYEAPGILKAGGTYFLIVSGKTGYRANPNQVFWTTELKGGTWNGPVGVAPEGEKTYGSQNTFELKVVGSKGTVWVFMGDAWDAKGGVGSNYVWVPMRVDGGARKVELEYKAQWRVDVGTGEVVVPGKKRRYEAGEAEGRGRVRKVRRRGVEGRGLPPNSSLTFRNVTGLGGRQWVQFHYRTAVSPEMGRAAEAYVIVNHGPAVNISSRNSRAGYHDVIPVELDLEAGDSNTIEFGVSGGVDAGVVIDGIELIED